MTRKITQTTAIDHHETTIAAAMDTWYGGRSGLMVAMSLVSGSVDARTSIRGRIVG